METLTLLRLMVNITKSVSLPKELIDKIDKERGLASFSAYVTKILSDQIEGYNYGATKN